MRESSRGERAAAPLPPRLSQAGGQGAAPGRPAALPFVHYLGAQMRAPPVLPFHAVAQGLGAPGVGVIMAAHVTVAAAGSIPLGRAPGGAGAVAAAALCGADPAAASAGAGAPGPAIR